METHTGVAETDLSASWERLHRAALCIAAERDPSSVLSQVAEQARELAGARSALVALPDDQGRPTQIVTAGMDAAEQAQIESLLHDLDGFEVLFGQRALFYARAQPLLAMLLGIPLCVGDEVVAAIVLMNSRSDVAAVQALADYAAVAILNARLAERIQHLEDELAHRTALQDAMVHEMSHRVRNSLQMAVGFLSYALTRRSAGSLEDAVRLAIDRIKGLGAVQEVLASTTQERIGFQELARRAVAVTVPETLSETTSLLVFEGPDVVLPAEQAKSLALAVNELVINAFRHGPEAAGRGPVFVVTTRDQDAVRITLHDEGEGLPEDLDARRDRGLGLSIARGLVERGLGGSLSLLRSDRGVSAVIRLPLSEGRREVTTSSDR